MQVDKIKTKSPQLTEKLRIRINPDLSKCSSEVQIPIILMLVSCSITKLRHFSTILHKEVNDGILNPKVPENAKCRRVEILISAFYRECRSHNLSIPIQLKNPTETLQAIVSELEKEKQVLLLENDELKKQLAETKNLVERLQQDSVVQKKTNKTPTEKRKQIPAEYAPYLEGKRKYNHRVHKHEFKSPREFVEHEYSELIGTPIWTQHFLRSFDENLVTNYLAKQIDDLNSFLPSKRPSPKINSYAEKLESGEINIEEIPAEERPKALAALSKRLSTQINSTSN